MCCISQFIVWCGFRLPSWAGLSSKQEKTKRNNLFSALQQRAFLNKSSALRLLCSRLPTNSSPTPSPWRRKKAEFDKLLSNPYCFSSIVSVYLWPKLCMQPQSLKEVAAAALVSRIALPIQAFVLSKCTTMGRWLSRPHHTSSWLPLSPRARASFSPPSPTQTDRFRLPVIYIFHVHIRAVLSACCCAGEIMW